MTRFINALNKRRALIKDTDKGFTLIELLVVVIIIGILAAIAIPIYLNIQNGAKDSAVQSDLTSIKTAVVNAQTQSATGAYPADVLPATLKTYGFSGYSTTYTVAPAYKAAPAANATAFCIQATSQTGTVFSVTESSGVVKAACS